MILGLAWFAAVNAGASIVSSIIAALDRTGSNRSGTTMPLAVRLFPAVTSVLFVTVIFAPGHWQLEPADAQESLGLVVYGLAVLGAALLSRSAVRAVWVTRAGKRLKASARLLPADPHLPALYEAEELCGVSLSGVVRTRILIGPAASAQLSSSELQAAVAHELAHRDALDNLKRYAMFCAPDLFGFTTAARRLERQWHSAAESLADARAVNGDPRGALHLASALVKVARLTADRSFASPPPSSLIWSTLHDPPLLERRVRRLLSGAPPSAAHPAAARGLAIVAIPAAVLLTCAPELARLAHQMTETVVRFLP
jgi:hypothetical protein